MNSINIAPVLIRCACLRIIGIAKLPTVDAPVRNFAASIHPPPSRVSKYSVDPPPKNMHGIGTNTYISADNIGHQLLYIAQARTCRRKLDENIRASPASTSTVIAICVNFQGAMNENNDPTLLCGCGRLCDLIDISGGIRRR